MRRNTNHKHVYKYNSKGLFSDSFIRKNTIPNKQIIYSGDNVGLAKKYGIKIITNDELNEYSKKIVDNFNKNKEYNINKIMKNIDFAKLQKESNSDKKLTFERIRKSIKLHSNNDDNGSINFYADSDLFDYFFLELNVNDVGKIIGIKRVKD